MQAEAMWEACLALAPDVGSYLCASAVRLTSENGQTAQAVELYDQTLERTTNPGVLDQINRVLADIDLSG